MMQTENNCCTRTHKDNAGQHLMLGKTKQFDLSPGAWRRCSSRCWPAVAAGSTVAIDGLTKLSRWRSWCCNISNQHFSPVDCLSGRGLWSLLWTLSQWRHRRCPIGIISNLTYKSVKTKNHWYGISFLSLCFNCECEWGSWTNLCRWKVSWKTLDPVQPLVWRIIPRPANLQVASQYYSILKKKRKVIHCRAGVESWW